jgi:predicted NBD/HSP70 family sugar kinase
VINIVDPHAIVLGGGLSRMTQLYGRVPELWKRYVFSEPKLIVTKLLPPRFGDSSGVRGAPGYGRVASDRSYLPPKS